MESVINLEYALFVGRVRNSTKKSIVISTQNVFMLDQNET